MRLIYAFRVVTVSAEALLLCAAFLVWKMFHEWLEIFAASLQVNEEIIKYLMLLPVVVAGWTINESRLLLQDDRETIRLLTLWDDYWRLKTHVWVALFYAVFFAALSMTPWTIKSGISTAGGLLLFVVSILGQLMVAATVYGARLRVKELLVRAERS
jgi:hypothetical protein